MTTKSLELESTDFLTSDIQLFDEALVKWRFATSIEHLHDRTAAIWDATVPAEATVLIVGDAIAYRTEEALAWYAARPGRKILVTGNWDEVNPRYRRQPEVPVEAWREVFPEIYDRGSVVIDDRELLVSHYTYSNAAKKPELVEQGVAFFDRGLPLVHGHTHSRKRVSRAKAIYTGVPGTLQLHVGWDAWKRPVSGQELLELADKEGW